MMPKPRMQILLIFLCLTIPLSHGCVTWDANLDHDIEANLHRRGANPPKQLPKTGITNVQYFDGISFVPGAVAMENGMVTFDLHDVTNWIDGKHGFLLPGLIDSHCHPAAIVDLELLSSYGITTAMSMSCPSYPLCASLRDQPGLTSFFTASRSAVGPNSKHAIALQMPPDSWVSSPSQAPQYIAEAFANNSDYIKIIAEKNGVPQDAQNALVELTHQRGKQSMTHAVTIVSYLQAIQSQTDGIQHTPGDGYITQSMLHDIQKFNQFVTPTTVIVKAFLSNSDSLARSDYHNNSWPIVVENVKRLHRARVPLLVGTDAIPNTGLAGTLVHNPLGSTMHDELEVLVNEVGIAPAEVLRAATSLPAKLHQLYDRGLIMEGKRADLLLLNSNPLLNISATRDIARVWNGGIEYIPLMK